MVFYANVIYMVYQLMPFGAMFGAENFIYGTPLEHLRCGTNRVES
jgi:hypothetical protein